MNNKQDYIKPEIEVISLSDVDIITCSDPEIITPPWEEIDEPVVW